jgi:hypothetical protein
MPQSEERMPQSKERVQSAHRVPLSGAARGCLPMRGMRRYTDCLRRPMASRMLAPAMRFGYAPFPSCLFV